MNTELEELRKELLEVKVQLQLRHMHQDTEEYQSLLKKEKELDQKFKVLLVKEYVENKKGK